jgi:hypothetical protein
LDLLEKDWHSTGLGRRTGGEDCAGRARSASGLDGKRAEETVDILEPSPNHPSHETLPSVRMLAVRGQPLETVSRQFSI